MLRRAMGAGLASILAVSAFGLARAGSVMALDDAADVSAPAARSTVTPVGATLATTETTTISPATRLVRMLNAERARQGLAPVRRVWKVGRTARIHSRDMAVNEFMSHTGSDGSSTGDRLDRVGFDWRGWGENVGAGYPTARSMFNGWMNSYGHRANMLGNYKYVGIAVRKSEGGVKYWTMVLAN